MRWVEDAADSDQRVILDVTAETGEKRERE